MTTIDDDVKFKEGEGQSYSKLYVNDSKELYLKDSGGIETNLMDGSNVSFDGYAHRVFVLESAISKTSTDAFVTYTIPANTLWIGCNIEVLAIGVISSYTSGSARMGVNINNLYLITDSEPDTVANGWQFYGHGSATVYSTGSSGSIARGGMGIFGLQGTRNSTVNCPVLVNGISSVDTTQDIDIIASCDIAGTLTAELRQFIITIS